MYQFTHSYIENLINELNKTFNLNLIFKLKVDMFKYISIHMYNDIHTIININISKSILGYYYCKTTIHYCNDKDKYKNKTKRYLNTDIDTILKDNYIYFLANKKKFF